MNDPLVAKTNLSVLGLGVHGLPQLTGKMIGGGLYVLVAETPTARFPMLSESIGNALADAIPCAVIVPSHPEVFLQRIEALGKFNSAELIAADQLQVFIMQDEFPKKMFRFGADAFVSELEQFGIANNSYVLFDQADDVLSLHDITLARDQIEVMKNWFCQHHITALLVFSRAFGANLEAINALMDDMSGIVRLGGGSGGLKLTFDYWQPPDGTIAARSYLLTTLESGLYEASNLGDQAAVSGRAEAVDFVQDEVPQYFYMNPDLGSLSKHVPGKWKLVDTLIGMLHATQGTRSSTSILLYQRNTNLTQMAETIHTLRMSLGRHVNIIVQEKDASLRYQNEALLLKLGTNLVVHRDVPTSRYPLILESLSKQVFSRDLDVNFEVALASVIPATASGYQTPPRFSREVRTILERVATLDIPCAMIVGKPTPGKAILDILNNSGLTRPGDMISSDGEYCYVFLNACPESEVLKTLARIFKGPIDTNLEDVRFLVRSEEILPELTALKHNAEGPHYVDYSTMIVPADRSPESIAVPESVAFVPAPARPTPVLTVVAPVPATMEISAGPLGAPAPVTATIALETPTETQPLPALLQAAPAPSAAWSPVTEVGAAVHLSALPAQGPIPQRASRSGTSVVAQKVALHHPAEPSLAVWVHSPEDRTTSTPAGIRQVARATRSKSL